MQKAGESLTTDSIGIARLWVCPAVLHSNKLHHTWVTSTTDVASCPPVAHYWYCWGVCHRAPSVTEKSKLLKEAPFYLHAAQQIAKADDASASQQAHAGIPGHYGYRGVCHQVSNRVLYATAVGKAPVTVEGAKGYKISRHLYGAYGRGLNNDFENRVKACGLDPKYVKGVLIEEEREFDIHEKGRYSTPDVMKVYATIREDMSQYIDSIEPLVQSKQMTIVEFTQAVEKRTSFYYRTRLIPAMGKSAFTDMFETNPEGPLEFLDKAIAQREDEERR
jgi:hypothetical protein